MKQCSSRNEEEGGYVLNRIEDYQFVKLHNVNHGKEIAVVEFKADANEYGEKVVAQTQQGWKVHSSFHTHPGSSTSPSEKDLTNIFRGGPTHFIHSPSHGTLSCYNYVAVGKESDERLEHYPLMDYHGEVLDDGSWERRDWIVGTK